MTIDRRDVLKHLLIVWLASVGGVGRALSGSVERFTAPRPPVAPEGTLSGAVRLSSITIPAGNVLRFDPDRSTTVEVSGNVLVEGTLRMRPARRGVIHTLRFVDVDESAFQGGGHEVLESDVGLWVRGRGRLDLVGAGMQGWNRTGSHPGWRDSDEIMVAPTATGDYDARPFKPGSVVPRARDDVPPAEVFNLTRNVRIEGRPGGRSHVHIMSSVPQEIRYAEFRHLGVPGALGRYPLHFHMMGNGSRGSIVQGSVVRDSGNNGFWMHLSNGITFRDCVAFNIEANSGEGAGSYGWDTGDPSHDITWDRCLAVAQDSSELFRTGMFLLGTGDGNACVDCAGAAFTTKSAGSGGSGVFHWGKKGINAKTGVWRFPEGNVAHNVNGNGLSTWQNDDQIHDVDGFIVYRAEGGIDHGAYQNGYRYRGGTIVECAHHGVLVHADSQDGNDGIVECRFERLTIASTPIGFNKLRSPNPGAPIVICDPIYRDVDSHVVVEEGAVEPSVRTSC